ncbi:MAG TPA: hypothetical protein RMH99_08660 [Sandaracinaceae bacterium LLY-WYZ-13_1]|nr:hypothetical protein [Sandaracinaceae bacterium LLY-WYZ-13_1]
MAERDSDTARSSEESPGKDRGRSRIIGRGIATALVVALLGYLIVVGFTSVVPQVFWPEGAAMPASVSCTEGLRDLRGELLGRAGDRVASGGGDHEALRAWLAGWDRRHLGLEDRCEGEAHGAWEQLGRLRQRLQATLERFDADEGQLARDLNHTLARQGR